MYTGWLVYTYNLYNLVDPLGDQKRGKTEEE
jgi:hypothetical protein